MQVHEYTHGSKDEATGRYFVRFDRCPSVQIDYWIEPRRVHLVVAKHVMRYLKGAMDYGVSYDGDHDFTLSGYTDAD